MLDVSHLRSVKNIWFKGQFVRRLAWKAVQKKLLRDVSRGELVVGVILWVVGKSMDKFIRHLADCVILWVSRGRSKS